MNGDRPTESMLRSAYRVLFPCEVEAAGEVLRLVDLSQIKKAYRRRALDTHPDRLAFADERLRKDSAERFIQVSEAYETLSKYLILREKGFCPGQNEAPGSGRPKSNRPPQRERQKHRNRFHGPGAETFGFSLWEKGIPLRRLRFGEFLYFSRVIPWPFLVRALVWQRKHRPRLGEIAQRWRWSTESQIVWVLKSRRPGEFIGEALLRRRIITPFQLSVLLWQQKKLQRPIGEVFIQLGLLTVKEVWRHLQHQEAHNLEFSSIFKHNESGP